mmetsp:Transcript_18708/g.54088  ORF Transcript_18708/g.54088 Transcript_18708/m.54088 type:complete len:362 (+) Transcript_18708:115-1200(+)
MQYLKHLQALPHGRDLHERTRWRAATHAVDVLGQGLQANTHEVLLSTLELGVKLREADLQIPRFSGVPYFCLTEVADERRGLLGHDLLRVLAYPACELGANSFREEVPEASAAVVPRAAELSLEALGDPAEREPVVRPHLGHQLLVRAAGAAARATPGRAIMVHLLGACAELVKHCLGQNGGGHLCAAQQAWLAAAAARKAANALLRPRGGVLTEADNVVNKAADAAIGHVVEDGLDRVPDGVAHVHAEHVWRRVGILDARPAVRSLFETPPVGHVCEDVAKTATQQRSAGAVHQHGGQLSAVRFHGELLVEINHGVAHQAQQRRDGRAMTSAGARLHLAEHTLVEEHGDEAEDRGFDDEP